MHTSSRWRRPDCRMKFARIAAGLCRLSFFDVLTLPAQQVAGSRRRGHGAVDRISPEDARAIREGGARHADGPRPRLFRRLLQPPRARERLSLGAAPCRRPVGRHRGEQRARRDCQGRGLDLDQLKARLFRAILKSERAHLEHVPELFADLEREIRIRFGEEDALPSLPQRRPDGTSISGPQGRRSASAPEGSGASRASIQLAISRQTISRCLSRSSM